jgi:hypothetical protein
MQNTVEIENIEDMRRRQGIDDSELCAGIRGLRAGDLVKLTLLSSTKAFVGETLLVRITRIVGATFHGKLADCPSSAELASVRVGAPLAFTAAHIHSIPKGQPAHKS